MRGGTLPATTKPRYLAAAGLRSFGCRATSAALRAYLPLKFALRFST
jgi:hypothetical protein